MTHLFSLPYDFWATLAWRMTSTWSPRSSRARRYFLIASLQQRKKSVSDQRLVMPVCGNARNFKSLCSTKISASLKKKVQMHNSRMFPAFHRVSNRHWNAVFKQHPPAFDEQKRKKNSLDSKFSKVPIQAGSCDKAVSNGTWSVWSSACGGQTQRPRRRTWQRFSHPADSSALPQTTLTRHPKLSKQVT